MVTEGCVNELCSCELLHFFFIIFYFFVRNKIVTQITPLLITCHYSPVKFYSMLRVNKVNGKNKVPCGLPELSLTFYNNVIIQFLWNYMFVFSSGKRKVYRK